MRRPNQLTLPLKWHGGKAYLADWIIAKMPRHLHYVEPFAGGLAVFLAKDPHDPRLMWNDTSYERGCSEVINDLNGVLVNFWRVLQDEEAFTRFQRRIAVTPFSQPDWVAAGDQVVPHGDHDVEAAVAFFVRCRQSRAGAIKAFATLSRNRTRRGMNEQVSAWLNGVEGLPAVHERLRRVVILQEDARTVIRRQDGDRTLFYLDPPYLHETRATPDVYHHEMDTAAHAELLDILRHCRGHVMLSGYPNELYDEALRDWSHYDRQIDNKVSPSPTKRIMTERLWCNF